MSKVRLAFIAFAALFVCYPFARIFADPSTNALRLPVPSAAALTAAEKDVRELFEHEYKVLTAEGRRSLALAMLKEADAPDVKDDPAARFALLRAARDASLDAGDFHLARAAVDSTIASFDIDPLNSRFEMLNGAFAIFFKDVKSLGSEDAAGVASLALDSDSVAMDNNLRLACQQELTLHWLLLVQDAFQAGQVAIAQKSAAQAVVTSSRTGDVDLQNAARLATAKADTANAIAKSITTLKEKLTATPDDPDINLVVGKYYCFVQDDWDTGRPFLLKGDDIPLKTLVQRDLASNSQSAEVMDLADDWWKFSEDATDKLGAISGKRRAVYWYQRALASLPAVKKATAEKRMAELATQTAATGHGAAVDVLALIDLSTVEKKGAWNRGPTGVFCTKAGGVFPPYSPPEEYDLYIDFTRDSGKDAVGTAFPMAMGCGNWILGGKGNHDQGITDATVNWVIRSGRNRGIENKRLYHTVVKVRRGRVSGFVDGEQIAILRTDGEGMTILDIPPNTKLTQFRLSISPGSTATYSSLMVLEITGQGKVIAVPATQPK
jgi:hypothetical protein